MTKQAELLKPSLKDVYDTLSVKLNKQERDALADYMDKANKLIGQHIELRELATEQEQKILELEDNVARMGMLLSCAIVQYGKADASLDFDMSLLPATGEQRNMELSVDEERSIITAKLTYHFGETVEPLADPQ